MIPELYKGLHTVEAEANKNAAIGKATELYIKEKGVSPDLFGDDFTEYVLRVQSG